jgi:hypothetical protein
MNFKFQPAAMFVCFYFHKSGIFKVVHPFKIYQCRTFHDTKLTGASFPSTSEVLASVILNGYRYEIKK